VAGVDQNITGTAVAWHTVVLALRTRLGNLGVFFGGGYVQRMSFGEAELAVGALGSLLPCDGRNGACRGGALAMASIRGSSLSPMFHASARVCVLCTVIEKRRGLRPLRWRDHYGGHGERIAASEAGVGAPRGLGVARMAVRCRGVLWRVGAVQASRQRSSAGVADHRPCSRRRQAALCYLIVRPWPHRYSRP
jgi:hypothetical protein